MIKYKGVESRHHYMGLVFQVNRNLEHVAIFNNVFTLKVKDTTTDIWKQMSSFAAKICCTPSTEHAISFETFP